MNQGPTAVEVPVGSGPEIGGGETVRRIVVVSTLVLAVMASAVPTAGERTAYPSIRDDRGKLPIPCADAPPDYFRARG